MQTEGASDEGMVIDFGQLKQMLQELENDYDHGFILNRQDTILMKVLGVELIKNEPMQDEYYLNINNLQTKLLIVDFIPTAENLAKHWYYYLKRRLDKFSIAIKYLKVWETPTSMAMYEK